MHLSGQKKIVEKVLIVRDFLIGIALGNIVMHMKAVGEVDSLGQDRDRI